MAHPPGIRQGGPLPLIEIAPRINATPAGISKHVSVLRASAIVRRPHRKHEIAPRLRVPGQMAVDIGHAFLRFEE